MPDHANVRVPPPLIYLLPLALAAFLNARWPLPLVPNGWTVAATIVAIILGVTGVVVMASAMIRFRRAGTSPIPIRPSTAFVATGPYRWTRNPMYLGFTAIYLSVTLLLRHWWPIILLPLTWWAMNSYVIGREERYLTSRFGDAYREYQTKVRRWI